MTTNQNTPTSTPTIHETRVEIWIRFGFTRETAELLEAVHEASIVTPTEEETLKFFEER
jgi:hypothetical protein